MYRYLYEHPSYRDLINSGRFIVKCTLTRASIVADYKEPNKTGNNCSCCCCLPPLAAATRRSRSRFMAALYVDGDAHRSSPASWSSGTLWQEESWNIMHLKSLISCNRTGILRSPPPPPPPPSPRLRLAVLFLLVFVVVFCCCCCCFSFVCTTSPPV